MPGTSRKENKDTHAFIYVSIILSTDKASVVNH